MRVTRETLVDAPPARVWRHLVDPVLRRRWLDGELGFDDLSPGTEGTGAGPAGPHRVRIEHVDEGRSPTYTRDDDTGRARVRIEVEPAGDGSRVRVTELLVTPPVGEPPEAWACSGPPPVVSASLTGSVA